MLTSVSLPRGWMGNTGVAEVIPVRDCFLVAKDGYIMHEEYVGMQPLRSLPDSIHWAPFATCMRWLPPEVRRDSVAISKYNKKAH